MPAIDWRAQRTVVGMIHLQALPGTPRATLSPDDIVHRAVEEALILQDAGFDALLVENMHDVPWLLRDVGPEIVSTMTATVVGIRDAVSLPVGVQVLAGANRAALAVAYAAGGAFVRAEGFVFASVADEGLLDEADAGPLLRYRRAMGADSVQIICDIKKKHSSHAITADVDLAATARAATLFGADALVVTGEETGAPVSPDDLKAVGGSTDLPVIVGSGVTQESARDLLRHADGLIVGSSIKAGGLWEAPIDPARAKALVAAARA